MTATKAEPNPKARMTSAQCREHIAMLIQSNTMTTTTKKTTKAHSKYLRSNGCGE